MPTDTIAAPARPAAKRPYWRDIVKQYEGPDTVRSLWQAATSVVPYLALWPAMYVVAGESWWLVLPLTILAAGFLMRTFIVFHDCAHSCFLRHRRANDWLGRLCGLLTWTPFYQWRHEHAMHHASAGDLDRRGTGDVTTLTVKEYQALGRLRRLRYRLYRNPVVMFGFGSVFLHGIMQRFPARDARPRERRSVIHTNIALLVACAGAGWLMGYGTFAVIQLLVTLWAGAAGIWLFYVQHQFEDTYWQDGEQWDYATAALQGSSYLKLPAVLQWFTGNIGLHHVHHLSSRIPNYRLQRAHDENELFQQVPVLTFWDGIRATRLKLWDEDSRRLIGWRELKALGSAPTTA